MTQRVCFAPNEAKFGSLKGKVVVLTGGASGIGASVIEQLYKNGAYIVFGHLNAQQGEALASFAADRVTFVHVDLSKYEGNVKLFRTAYAKYNRVDHAVSCAGIPEFGSWFDPALTLETVEKPERNKALAVNLPSLLYFARIAAVYLREGKKEDEDKSLTLLSSIAGFREATIHECSKNGVVCLMRSFCNIVHLAFGIRVHAICLGMTDTPMMEPHVWMMQAIHGVATNSSEEIAKIVLGLQVEPGMNGEAIYAEGAGCGLEIEDGLENTMDLWLGEELSTASVAVERNGDEYEWSSARL